MTPWEGQHRAPARDRRTPVALAWVTVVVALLALSLLTSPPGT